MRAAFAQPGFRRLFAGLSTSMLGDSIMLLVLSIWVKTLTGSSAMAGFTFFFMCLPAIFAPLADAVDAFCEGIGFTPAQTERVFAAAKANGLPVKLHAEQLSHAGGAALPARFGGLSADHLEYATEDDARAMAKAGTAKAK